MRSTWHQDLATFIKYKRRVDYFEGELSFQDGSQHRDANAENLVVAQIFRLNGVVRVAYHFVVGELQIKYLVRQFNVAQGQGAQGRRKADLNRPLLKIEALQLYLCT